MPPNDHAALEARAARLAGYRLETRIALGRAQYRYVGPHGECLSWWDSEEEARQDLPHYCDPLLGPGLIRRDLLPKVEQAGKMLDLHLILADRRDEAMVDIPSWFILTLDPAVLVEAVCDVLEGIHAER